MLDEEDECSDGGSGMIRLIPGKIFKINYIIHPVVAGFLQYFILTLNKLFIYA